MEIKMLKSLLKMISAIAIIFVISMFTISFYTDFELSDSMIILLVGAYMFAFSGYLFGRYYGGKLYE